MIVDRMPVSVVVERRASTSRWQPYAWRAVAVLPGRAEAAPWTILDQGEGWTRFHAGTGELVLYSGETEGCRLNLDQDEPKVWVVLRSGETETGLTLLLTTVDAGEAQAHVDTGNDLVEAVPMPPAIHGWLTDFVARHHVDRRKWKRKRDRADPEAMSFGSKPAREDWDD